MLWGYIRLAETLPPEKSQKLTIRKAAPDLPGENFVVEQSVHQSRRRNTQFDHDYPALHALTTNQLNQGDTVYVVSWEVIGTTDGDVDRAIAAANRVGAGVYICEEQMLCQLDRENAQKLYAINDAAKASLFKAKSDRLNEKRGQVGGRPRAFDRLAKPDQEKIAAAWGDPQYATGEAVRELLIELLPDDHKSDAPTVRNMSRWPELGQRRVALKKFNKERRRG